MWRRKLPRQQPGKPIQAATINRTAEAAEWASRIQADPPLAIVATAFGPLLRYAGQIFGIYLATSTTTITARSGATPGSGTVELYLWDGTSIVDLGVSKTAYNWNTATGGISSGKNGIVIRIGDVYWALVFEC